MLTAQEALNQAQIRADKVERFATPCGRTSLQPEQNPVQSQREQTQPPVQRDPEKAMKRGPIITRGLVQMMK